MAAPNPVVEAAASREYFHVGGGYKSTKEGTLFHNQMYVEKLVPVGGISQKYPLVFVHGGAQTGTNWLNKPDGGPGWASWFLNHGYEIYIVDQTTRGRSPWMAFSEDIGVMTVTAEIIQKQFTATKEYNAFPQSQLHTQWPGTGRMGDPVFDAYFSSLVPFVPNTYETETLMKNAGVALLDKIGPAVLITHSQGGIYGWLWGDARPDLVKAIVSIEPAGPPFKESIMSPTAKKPFGLTSLPLTFEPPVLDERVPLRTQVKQISTSGSEKQVECVLQEDPPRQLVNLSKIPVLVETGEASYHAAYDHCTVEFLRQAGVSVEHMRLGQGDHVGIRGNGHMQFMEKNSDEIAEVLEFWIRKTASG